MQPQPPSDHLRIARHFLLSSPPGQFDILLEDLTELISLSKEWIDNVRTEFHTLTGRQALDDCNPTESSVSTLDDESKDSLGLKEGMKTYMERYYSGKGVMSHYVIDTSVRNEGAGSSSGDGSEEHEVHNILVYAERIQLPKFHAGSWTARYSIEKTKSIHNKNDVVFISGKVVLHAHSFENGNVQLKSTVDFPSTQVRQEDIFQKMQEWDESIVNALRIMYEDISSHYLKKFRRVMPVTRTRFDWNLLGHRGIRHLGDQVLNQKERR